MRLSGNIYTDTNISAIGQYWLIILANGLISRALFKNIKTTKVCYMF